jgi:ribosomal protein S12 methylthiotransferase
MKPSENPRKQRISLISLGCSKNLVDSERMLGLLSQHGFTIVADGAPADLAVVNTCGFIDAARRESREVIESTLRRKRAGEVGGVIVAGCLAERERERLLDEFPEVDGVIGVFAREEVAEIARKSLGGIHEQRTLFRPAAIQAQDDRARLRVTPRHLSYLKVSEGCDRLCTFCAIPLMRGKHVSKPLEKVVEEAQELAADGVRELILVAQDMTYYGIDLYGRPRLAELLRELDRIEELDWIRILYNYPHHFTDELFDVLAGSRRILPYLDIPLQHINDRLLKLMNRRHTRAETVAILERLRRTIPNLVLRTTFLVGFPGETEAEFEELVGFIQEYPFERLGVFTYSLEPDTPSAKLPDHLSEEVKQGRRDRLMAVQQPIAFAFHRSLVGRTLDVLVDAPAPQGSPWWIGRTYADAPDVDGITLIRGVGLRPGDLVACEIVEAEGYDLVARPRALPQRRKRARPEPRRRPPSLPILDHS